MMTDVTRIRVLASRRVLPLSDSSIFISDDSQIPNFTRCLNSGYTTLQSPFVGHAQPCPYALPKVLELVKYISKCVDKNSHFFSKA